MGAWNFQQHWDVSARKKAFRRIHWPNMAQLPNCGMRETKDASYVVSMEFPGISKESTNVSIEDNILTVREEKKVSK